MKNVTIHRCPSCSTIGDYTKQLESELRNDADVSVSVLDGNKGEFSVEVDGQRIEGLNGENLRPVSELAEEIREAEVTTAI